MDKFSPALLNKLTEFLLCEIGGKSLDGITYAMILKDDEDSYKRYMDIKREVVECGYSNDEVFRVYELSNGFIFDMDLPVAKKITRELVRAVGKADGSSHLVNKDLIGDGPSKRRDNDIKALAKFIKQKHEEKEEKVAVALFSRNSVPRIMVTGRGQKGELLTIKYNAYAIRHCDIEFMNANILIPYGIRVAKVEPCEILPNKTGCKFILHIEEV